MNASREHQSVVQTYKSPANHGAAPLLDVAARLFREHGVAGTSVRAIADASGMMLGSVTYRYPSKESLVLARMQRAATSIPANIAEGHGRYRT